MDADSSMKSQVFVDEWRVRESRTVKNEDGVIPLR